MKRSNITPACGFFAHGYQVQNAVFKPTSGSLWSPSIYCNLSAVATLDLIYKRIRDLRYLCFSFDWWRNLGFSSWVLACNWRSRPCDSVAPFEVRCDFFVKFRLPWSLTGSPLLAVGISMIGIYACQPFLRANLSFAGWLNIDQWLRRPHFFLTCFPFPSFPLLMTLPCCEVSQWWGNEFLLARSLVSSQPRWFYFHDTQIMECQEVPWKSQYAHDKSLSMPKEF